MATPRRVIGRLLLLWAQQAALSHTLSHAQAPSKSLAADRACGDCLAYAQFFSALGTSQTLQAATRPAALRLVLPATPERCLYTDCMFEPRASAMLSAISTLADAQSADSAMPKVYVTAAPFKSTEGDQILAPAKILAGDELRDKVGNSLGETLSQELGVFASAFGAGASRPIIRGLEGPRVKMLENGMAVSDVSGLSNDHAVAAEGAIAHQIEILRGPAALLYGSGAIGGPVNVVNERIPTTLEPKPIGQLETRYSSVDSGRSVSGTGDAAFGGFNRSQI